MFEIGPSLREARLHKGVEIPDAERATKIRAKYLRALETESFDILPGQAYIKSFLRSYADYLGLDGQLFVDEYTSRFWVDEEPGPVRTRRIRIRERHHRRAERRMVVLTVVGIAVVTALVIAAWNYGGSGAAATSIPNLTPAVRPHVPAEPGRLRGESGHGRLAARGAEGRRHRRRALPGNAREGGEAAVRREAASGSTSAHPRISSSRSAAGRRRWVRAVLRSSPSPAGR